MSRADVADREDRGAETELRGDEEEDDEEDEDDEDEGSSLVRIMSQVSRSSS
jgi:hypothetical protein